MYQNNPLFFQSDLPRFDLIKPEHFTPALKVTFEQINEKLDKMEANIIPTWAGICEPLSEFNAMIDRTWKVLDHLIDVKNSPELLNIQREFRSDYVSVRLRMEQSKPIYEGLKNLKASQEYQKLTSSQKRVVDLRLQTAESVGVGLDEIGQKKYKEVFERIHILLADYSRNIRRFLDTYEYVVTDIKETEGWPESLLRLTAHTYAKRHGITINEDEKFKKGPWSITFGVLSTGSFFTNCANRQLREKIYHACIAIASFGENDNTPIIKEILKLRKKEAEILGHKTFADLRLATKMAKTAKNVFKTIDELVNILKPYGEAEYDQLNDFAKKHGLETDLQKWDVAYWTNLFLKENFGFDSNSIKDYFSFPNVIKSLFSLCRRLFNITIKENLSPSIPKWHSDVMFFDFFDENNKVIGHLYIDPYDRPEEKNERAYTRVCSKRRVVNGTIHNPVSYMILDLNPPLSGSPSLMCFQDVSTLFHEFGHVLQSLLTTVDEPEVNGISGIKFDAVELPSQFMENWCKDPEILAEMAKHYETNKPMPEKLFKNLKNYINYGKVTDMLYLLSSSKTDMYIHSKLDPECDQDIFAISYKIDSEINPGPALSENKNLCAFTHIFGHNYCAGYYTYVWSQILSSDAFGAFEEVGLNNKEAIRKKGMEYRNTILALGGSKPAEEVFRSFRGRDPSTKALVRHLIGK